MLLRGKFFTFIMKAIGFLIVISVAWYFITPAYNRLLLAAADMIVSPALILSLEQDTIYIYIQNISDPIGGIYILALHYGLIVVVSLILATPGLRIYQRLKSIAIALVAIFIVHLISVVLFAQTALSGAGASMEHNPLIVFFAIIGADLFPILIWGVLSYKYFLARPGKPAARYKTKAGGYKVSEVKIS